MFVRVKHVQSGARVYDYLQIVENRRVGGKVRQRLVATLGRLEEMRASGGLDALIEGLAKHSAKLRLLEAREKKLPDAFEHLEGWRSWLATIVLGLVGALVGYAIFRLIGIGDDDVFDLGGIIGAVIGSILVLLFAGWVMRRTGRTV